MGKAVAGGTVAAVAQIVIEKLTLLMILLKFHQVEDLVDDMEKLKSNFMWIQETLEDTGMQHTTSSKVKQWLSKLEEVSIEAYRALDVFYYREMRIEGQYTVIKKLRLGSQSKVTRRRLGRKIKYINDELDSLIIKEATDLGIHQMILGPAKDTPVVEADASAGPETDSFSLDPVFIGREEDMHKIVDMIAYRSDDQVLSILPIVGMGGLGKTTLARQLYHYERVIRHFEFRVWVHVSTTFDSTLLFKKILSTVTLKKVEVEIKEVVLSKLRDSLGGKRFLLVLDDVWNQDRRMWEDFINPLRTICRTKGNCIIVTTRNNEVGYTVGTFPNYKLNGLSDDGCWSIIKERAFGERETPQELQNVGEKIAARCKGMPSVANIVGELLCGKSKEEWLSVEKYWLSDADKDDIDEDENNILKILKLKLRHLPSQLHSEMKPIFGSDFKSESYEDIRAVDERATQTADEYVLKEKDYSVSVKEDQIEIKLDRQTILIEDVRSSTQSGSSLVNPVLNLIEQNMWELPEKPYGDSFVLFLQRNYHLTFIPSSFFDSMPNLRFLDLSDIRIRILPDSLYSLPKLKVLMLSNCDGLGNLSSDIGNLNQVEVLDLSGTTELYSLPDETGQLVLLRHLKLSFYGPDNESEFGQLPSQLVSPSVLSKLEVLQSLSITVHPDDHRWTKIASDILKEVNKLEMLSCLQFYFPKVEIFEEYSQTNPAWKKHALTKFNFIVGHDVKQVVSRVPDEVESLFNQQDKCLKLVNGDKVTQFIKTALIQVTAFYLDRHTGIRSLSEFDISNFKLLKFCVVSQCPNIQAIMDRKTDEGAFPCLEYLGVYFLWELKHIWKPPTHLGRQKRVLKAQFEALKCLVVKTCPKLQFIFWESMLQCLSNLDELVVEDCGKVEKIVKEEKKLKAKSDDVILPRLRKLVLHYLPELVCLGNGLRYLEEFDVYGCPKLLPVVSQP